MSNIFGDGTDSGGLLNNAPSSYDLVQNTIFNQAINDLQNSIAGSTVNLNPIIARLDGLDADQITQNNNIATKLNISIYNTDKAELTAWRGGVDDTFTQFFNEIGTIEALNTTQDNRILALENNIASGYVTQSQLYAVETTQQVKNDSQDAQISDIYSRLGGTGQTVDLGPLTTRVTALEAQDVIHTNAINTKATTAYVDFKADLVQQNVDTKLPIDTYLGDLLNVTNRLNAIESVNATQTTNINSKLNITTYNTNLTTQTNIDNAQNTRLTNVENSIANFVVTASNVSISQPEINLQAWMNAQDTLNAGNAIDIGNNTNKIANLEDIVINNPIIIPKSSVTGLQTDLTNLQNQITTNLNVLNNHTHTAANITTVPITNLTQTTYNVQKTLEAINSRVDAVTVNSTGFTAYNNTLLANWGNAANALAIPSNLFAPNYVSNDEIATTISGNRGSVIWGINQNLTRDSNVGFKTLRLNSRFPANATALSSSDNSMTTWDFSLANTITPGSQASNYYRQNPWRMSYYNPYSVTTQTIWSVRGPISSGDTSGIRMVVDPNMVLMNVDGTVSMKFVDMIIGINNNTTGLVNINTSVNNLSTTVNTFNNSITTNTNSINNITSQIANFGTTFTSKAISMRPYIGSSGDLNGQNFSIIQDGPAATSTTVPVFGVTNEGGVAVNNNIVISKDRAISATNYAINNSTVIDGSLNARFNQLTLGGNFVYNGNLWIANGNGFFDNNRTINATTVTVTGLSVAGQQIINSSGAIFLKNNLINSDSSRVVLDTSGSLSSPFIDISNTTAPNGTALSIPGQNTSSFIKFNGDARFGDSLQIFNTNGLLIRNDLSVQDPTFGAIISIRRNCRILNIPNLTDVNDINLGYNNTIGGNWISPFGGQRNNVICGAGNRITASRCAIIGTNNTLESTLDSSFFVLGYGWDIGQLTGSVEHAADYILLGNGLNENSNNAVYMTIAGGMRMPTGSSGFNVYLNNSSSGNLLPTNGLTFFRGVSARKYKKEIQQIPNGTFKIDELQPVVYTLKDSGAQEVGFVADDLMGTSWQPFVVQMDGEVEALNYQHMVTGLVDVIKQQAKLINSLEQRMKNLEINFSRLNER